MFINGTDNLVKNTSHRVVLPFYTYAAISFLLAATMIIWDTSVFTQHYFSPKVLAITHTMALGWGTMIILGASYQLLPVLIEGKLFSEVLAYLSFGFAAIGIPILIYAFYDFHLGIMAEVGSMLISLAVICYSVNLWLTLVEGRNKSVHAIFVFTAALWLLFTVILGLLLVCNFTRDILPANSIHYLSLHAHLGIIGWFLLMITGVGSRLIPMFLISKYENRKLLWWIYLLINSGLAGFVLFFLCGFEVNLFFIPGTLVGSGIILFAVFVYRTFVNRIRKKIDEQIKMSIFSTIPMIISVIILASLIALFNAGSNTRLVLLYGFVIFFGWITAIILGMTFKTLPFIIWNKVYHHKTALLKTPNPKELLNHVVYKVSGIIYLSGFVVFSVGIIWVNTMMLNVGAFCLLITAILYNFNVFKVLAHKST